MDAIARFYDPRNIDRYRKLADERIGAAQRRRILEALAEEQAKLKADVQGG